MTPETPRHTIRPGGLDALGTMLINTARLEALRSDELVCGRFGKVRKVHGTMRQNSFTSAPNFSGIAPALLLLARMSVVVVGILLWFMNAIIPAMAGAPAQGAIDPSLPPPQRCHALGALSAQLLETAGSGKGHAPSFRIDVVHYREALRNLLTDNEKLPAAERLPRILVLDMVRMVALLQSAAECQTGRYIVCPPDLMDKLRQQQAAVDKGLAAMPTKPP